MTDSGYSSSEEAALAFSVLFSEDRRRGVVRNLEEYLRLHPGHDARIAREFVRLTEEQLGGGAGGGEGGDASARPFSVGEAGERLGPYRIEHELGRGGQGAVYLAVDTRVGRTVALKLLTGRAQMHPLALERFRREASIAAKLDHPGICPVYDVGQERGVPYLAMKVVRGESLSKKITTARDRSPDGASGGDSTHIIFDSQEPPPPRPPSTQADPASGPGPATQAEIFRIVRLVEQAARALHAAHEAGVVHRDVKPGNIMVTAEGEPVVLDFGLAQDTEGDAPTLTQTGELMGTPAYMSPEQIAAHRIRLDRRTDVYSLGVTLFECLTLKRPFDAPTREGLYQAILTKDAPDVRRLNPAVSDDLRVVVETALEKDRDRRYATALDLAEELRRIRSHEPIKAKPAGPLLKVYRWTQRNPALAAALIGLFVVLAAGLATSLVLLDKRDEALFAKTTALGQAETERNAKSAALVEVTNERNAKSAALADYDRLGDVSRLTRLTTEAETFWPAEPTKAAAMRRWLDDARKLEQNLPGHRAVRDALRASPDLLPYTEADRAADAAKLRPVAERRDTAAKKRNELAAALTAAESRAASRPATASAPASRAAESRPTVEELRASLTTLDAELSTLDARLKERLTWRFGTESAQFKHDTIGKLVEDLERFLDPDPFVGAMASVTKRLRFAEAVEQETLKKYAEKWAAARASIADPKQCPQYGGLQLAPQLGLIPIRKDPQSGLWEFAHLQTTAEGVDPIPAVRADGRYDLQESTGLIFVLIPGGTFQMGARLPTDEEEEESSDGGVPLPPNVDRQAAEQEGPVHTVALSHFFISKFEMTQGQWSRIAGRNPARFRPGAGAMTDERPVTLLHPVEMISWDDCFGDRGRLTRVELDAPTEAQWEYACRANTTTPWWCGMENRCLQTTANVADAFMRINGGPTDKAYEVWNDGYSLHSCVGSLAPNQFGLYDMSGNVWEWCRDGFMGYPLATPRVGDGLRLPHAGYHISSHILRGGSFFYSAREARSAARNGGVPTLRDFNLGVRPIFQPTQR